MKIFMSPLPKMNSLKNQNGFATLEIILIMLIISVLVGVAVPKMSRMMDIAQLNYETKKFVSDFYFAKSLSKSSKFEPEIFSSVPFTNGDGIIFSVANRSYQIKRSNFPVTEIHYLPKKFQITAPSNLKTVTFGNGKTLSSSSGTYIFKSPLGLSNSLKLDSVGRLHAERNKLDE